MNLETHKGVRISSINRYLLNIDVMYKYIIFMCD